MSVTTTSTSAVGSRTCAALPVHAKSWVFQAPLQHRQHRKVQQSRTRQGWACRAQQQATAAVEGENGAAATEQEEADVPTPVVKIDNQHDPFATVVTIEYGNRLGELLDTIAALKNLKLNIRRAKIPLAGGINKFYITDALTSEKITKSRRLEEIRLTILNNLIKFHPESGHNLAWGTFARKDSVVDSTNPLGPRNRAAVATVVDVVEDESGSHSIVHIKTRDRPGLLTDIVRVLKDISVNVISAEVDTEGVVARDEFYVTYHGEPLSKSMTQLVTNALQYYLQLAEVEREESY